ncbi:hypothetical protein ACQV5M_20375, partial [Leptospira sp. SA-E8]|uniref:hypothetical protein n=1 Tax=Leptospira sp. SA-E8 TaxID=3422259 RepID=UPI003EBEBEBC
MTKRPEQRLPAAAVAVRRADYRDARDTAALVNLLDMYARDPMGGGEGLSEEVKRRLPADLAAQPGAVSFIAWRDEEAVGLA